MALPSTQWQLHVKRKRGITVLQKKDSIDIVARNILELLSAVEQYRLASFVLAVDSLAVSAQREVRQARVHVVS
jgi:hypothetical protein